MNDLGRVAIIGAGPTGLGAAWRLKELGHDDLTIYESSDRPGGLAASFVDRQGFTWDVGGHVQFSHYPYFDRVMDEVLPGDAWHRHERRSSIMLGGRLIPYPFQYNLHRLAAEDMRRCLDGLPDAPPPKGNFRDWMLGAFGPGIAELFMLPYNEKVWAVPASAMSCDWLDERVAAPDRGRIRRNAASGKDDVSWGPNNLFRFPRRGGTGAIWRAVAGAIGGDRIALARPVASVAPAARTLTLADGSERPFDLLLNTAPLDRFAAMVRGLSPEIAALASKLTRSAVHVVGIGLRGRPPARIARECWMYFPERDLPFHRATVFSNYSPDNVPDPAVHWSLMTEVSESSWKPVDAATIAGDVLRACRAAGLVTPADVVVSVWHHRAGYGYPTPTIDRDAILAAVQPALERLGLWSRGRFGGWKYEVSNQDHSFMQGVEWAERMMLGEPERTYRPAAAPVHADRP